MADPVRGISGKVAVVTGGAGFIGSHLVEALLASGAAEVRVLDNLSSGALENLKRAQEDPRVRLHHGRVDDRDKMRDCFAGSQLVFHLAAVKHPAAGSHLDELFRTNVVGTYEALEAARLAEVERFVFASSLYVYGFQDRPRLGEDDPQLAGTPYGATKVAGEQFCYAYRNRFGLPVSVLRYFFVYGPRLYRDHYLYAFVPKTLERIALGQPPEIYGDGQQTFDYVFIEDAVDATLRAASVSVDWGVYNVATGVPTTILDLTRLLLQLTGSGLDPVFGPPDETHGTIRVGDPRRAADELGFVAQTSVLAGMRRVVAWQRGSS